MRVLRAQWDTASAAFEEYVGRVDLTRHVNGNNERAEVWAPPRERDEPHRRRARAGVVIMDDDTTLPYTGHDVLAKL